MGISLQRPDLEAQVAADVLVNPRNGGFYKSFRVERWFSTAVNSSELRQRVAFALSQILVLSDGGATLPARSPETAMALITPGALSLTPLMGPLRDRLNGATLLARDRVNRATS